MFLAPDGDEIEIANAAAEFLGQAIPLDRLHAPGNADLSAINRSLLGEMGWYALSLPEERDGSGLTAVEHALFFREVGRLCGPIDILVQVLAAHIADDNLRPPLLAGEQGVALAIRDQDKVRLVGAPDATLALMVEQERASLFDISSMISEHRDSLDIANSFRVGSLDDCPTLARTDGAELWCLGQLGTAAMQIGIAEVALEQIVEYAKVRETFGKKIGSYQAVRHPCADMALRAETARCQVWFAAAALKEGRADIAVHLDAAKHLANQAALANADSNIQLHGGIGVTDEHHAHLLLKHAWLLNKLFGAKRALLSRLLDARVES